MAMDVPKSQVIQVIQAASSFGRNQDPLRDTSLPSVEQKVLRMWEQCLPDLAHNATLRGMTTVAINQISIFTMSTTSVDWPSETALPITKEADFAAMASRTGHGLVVLMTGATGFLGRAILECLANASEVALVHCIAVRSLHKTIAHPKILYHIADLTQPRLGLSSSDWEQLTKSVDIIVHAAALVDCIRPYSSLRTTNVQPTKKLVQFAAHRKIPIHYISSAGVGRFVGHTTFPEMGVAGYPPPVGADGYTMSKWASESILEKTHTTLGIPVMLHRPTGTIGSSSTTMDMLTDLFNYSKELRAVPTFPEIEGAFDIVSVEVMARTIVRDALQPIKGINFSSIGGVKTVPVKDLHIAVAMDTGVQMERVHLQEWVRKVVQAGMDKEVAHLFEISMSS
jgi:thioester reductase-like protein